MVNRVLLALTFLGCLGGVARGQLQVVDVADGAGVNLSSAYFIVTDPGHWEVRIDKATGAIFSFRDLTDAGISDGQGGVTHTNYVGTHSDGVNFAYYLRTPLLYVEGCSGTTDRIFTLAYPVVGLADRLSYSLSADGRSFTITYAENSDSTDFLWDPSTYLIDGVAAGGRGDLLTTAVLTLHEADAEGTVFRLAITVVVSQPLFGEVGTRVFQEGWVVNCIRGESSYSSYNYEIHQSIDWEDSRIDGEWDEALPVSFVRRTILDDANNRSLGLTAGRTFILDHIWGFEGQVTGGEFDTGLWSGARWVKQQFSRGMSLVDGAVVQQVVDLRINIVAEDDVPALSIAAETDYDWVYQNLADGEAIHKSVLTVAIADGLLADETYDVAIGESEGDLCHFEVSQPVTLDAEGTQRVDVFGGRMGDAAAVPGEATLTIRVVGRTYGQSAEAEVPLELRRYGDINGDGTVTAADKLEINKQLNGMATFAGIGVRELDLTADGVINAEDKLQINRVLNGLL